MIGGAVEQLHVLVLPGHVRPGSVRPAGDLQLDDMVDVLGLRVAMAIPHRPFSGLLELVERADEIEIRVGVLEDARASTTARGRASRQLLLQLATQLDVAAAVEARIPDLALIVGALVVLVVLRAHQPGRAVLRLGGLECGDGNRVVDDLFRRW